MDLIAIIFSAFFLLYLIAMLAVGSGQHSLDRHDTQHPNNQMEGVDQIRMDEDGQKRKKAE